MKFVISLLLLCFTHSFAFDIGEDILITKNKFSGWFNGSDPYELDDVSKSLANKKDRDLQKKEFEKSNEVISDNLSSSLIDNVVLIKNHNAAAKVTVDAVRFTYGVNKTSVYIKTTSITDDHNLSGKELARDFTLDPNAGLINIRFDIFDYVYKTNKLKNMGGKRVPDYGLGTAHGISLQLGAKYDKINYIDKEKEELIGYLGLLYQYRSFIEGVSKPNESIGTIMYGGFVNYQYANKDYFEYLNDDRVKGIATLGGFLKIHVHEKVSFDIRYVEALSDTIYNSLAFKFYIVP